MLMHIESFSVDEEGEPLEVIVGWGGVGRGPAGEGGVSGHPL